MKYQMLLPSLTPLFFSGGLPFQWVALHHCLHQNYILHQSEEEEQEELLPLQFQYPPDHYHLHHHCSHHPYSNNNNINIKSGKIKSETLVHVHKNSQNCDKRHMIIIFVYFLKIYLIHATCIEECSFRRSTTS